MVRERRAGRPFPSSPWPPPRRAFWRLRASRSMRRTRWLPASLAPVVAARRASAASQNASVWT
jgi:hypothetical protein